MPCDDGKAAKLVDSLSADLVIPTVTLEDNLPRYGVKLEQSNGAMPCDDGKPANLVLKMYYFKPLDLNENSCTVSVENKVENGLTLDEDDDPEFIEGLAALADLEDEEELEELREAATFHTETYRMIKDVGFSTIILPKHIRWNSLFDSLVAFLQNFKSLEVVNKLFSSLTHPLLTKEDIELLNEYMEVMKPLAVVLDILQGDKGVFLGVGLGLPLITRLKDLLNQRVYLHLGPIRDRVLEKVDKRFGKLFGDPWYLMEALTHPGFKAHWTKDRRSQENAKLKLRQLIQDATYSPVLEKS
ncbi:hypothetical protein GHT06_000219 [Daphnia sinensis]|uniref:Uncharacterized protein n=1 Tax=Daphnia sinensis TaxID=1820382 RepID=A0AAD5L4H8_9CRUS|nr:hypothetical protein GHT06_000219 [Daphnia sinensis]